MLSLLLKVSKYPNSSESLLCKHQRNTCSIKSDFFVEEPGRDNAPEAHLRLTRARFFGKIQKYHTQWHKMAWIQNRVQLSNMNRTGTKLCFNELYVQYMLSAVQKTG